MDAGSTQRIPQAGGWAQLIELPALAVRVIEGPDKRLGTELCVDLLRIGTDPANDLVLTDPAVSRFHLIVRRTPEGLLAADQGSTNGTFLEGARIKEGFLHPGSVLKIGSTVLKVEEQHSRQVVPPDPTSPRDGLIGASEAMCELRSVIGAVARKTVSVLIDGETGTGKEVVARAIHAASGRAGELIVFDCASIQKDLIQSELFGHRGGAFTGAAEARVGACRAANRGTLFIDELGELPLELQPTFLRFLERREVKALGADQPVPVDVRVVAATHVDLTKAVEDRRFRADLYHRLKVVRLRLPPLRERREDIPLLIEHFLRIEAATLDITPAARRALHSYDWPGNIRELRHVVDRLLIFCADRPVEPADLDLESSAATAAPPLATTGEPLVLTAATIREALASCGGSRVRAAALLGISRTTLFRRMRDLGLSDEGATSE